MNHSQIQEFFLQQDKAFREIIKKYNLTPASLEAILQAPALNMNNVQDFMNKLSKEELANLFYTTGLVKLSETVEAAQAKHNEQSHPSSGPPPGSSEAVPDEGQSSGSD